METKRNKQLDFGYEENVPKDDLFNQSGNSPPTAISTKEDNPPEHKFQYAPQPEMDKATDALWDKGFKDFLKTDKTFKEPKPRPVALKGEVSEASSPKQTIRFSDISFPPREHIIDGLPLDRKLLYVHSFKSQGT